MLWLHSVIMSREQVVRVNLSVWNNRELAELLRRRHGKSLGPRKRTALIDRRSADRGSAEWLAVGANSKGLAFLGAELVESLIISREGDGAVEGVLDTVNAALLRIDGQAVPEDLEGVLRHVREDVEEALAVKGEVGVQRVRRRWDGKGITLEEHVEHADANSPNIGLRGGVTGVGGIVLLRSHVAVTANSNFPRPGVGSSKTEVAKLHRAILHEEDVLRLDVAVVYALGVDELNGTDQLHHEVANVLRLQGTLIEADGLVKVAIGAILQHEVDVVVGLPGLNEINNVGVVAKTKVDTKLLRTFINGKGSRAVDSGRGLSHNLDGNKLVSGEVLGLKDHAERAMVESRDGFVSAMKHNTCLELITHTLH